VEYITAPFSLKEFFQLKEKINLQVKQLMEQNEVEFAGETGTMIIKNEGGEN
jgi:hypothetical protein